MPCGSTQAPRRHPDLPPHPGGRLLLRRQDLLRPTDCAGRRHPLLPVSTTPVRQEPVRGHPQGAVRGQRALVPRTGRPRRVGLVEAPSRRTAELRRRKLQAAGGAARERHAATRCVRTPGRTTGLRRAHARGTLRRPSGGAARPDGPARRRPGGRVRQADPGRAGRTGACRRARRNARRRQRAGDRQPRRPARAVRHHQGLRRARRAHLHHRCEQVQQGEPVLRTEQPHRSHPELALLGDLRLHGCGPRHGVRAGAARAGARRDPRLVQRLRLAGKRERLQPLRHPASLRQPGVRGALVRDRDPALPDRHPAPARLRGPGPRERPRRRRPAVDLRRGRHGPWRRCCSRPAT